MTQKMLARYLVEAVAMETGVPVDALKGRAQNSDITAARRLVYFATPEVGLSLSEMARYLNRNHSTICKTLHNFKVTAEDRRLLEAIKLTAHFVARERSQKFTNAVTSGVTL